MSTRWIPTCLASVLQISWRSCSALAYIRTDHSEYRPKVCSADETRRDPDTVLARIEAVLQHCSQLQRFAGRLEDFGKAPLTRKSAEPTA